MGDLEIDADRVEKIVCRGCGTTLEVSDREPLIKFPCPKCGTENFVPLRMANFLLLELLGRGGMGAVYRALDETLGRYVAIKVMRRSLAADRKFVENFLREARAAAALSHPNVVQVYSCGEWRGQLYIVMELVDGGKLDEEISKGEPMDEVRALEIALDVAEGLRAAAEIGLVHGDIKPANILFDSHGTAKVADFGLARFAHREKETGKEIWGTPYYIAPEKARGQTVDHRADIYSLGATIYHALGAKPPFEGETATDVVLARLKNPAIGLRVIRPGLQPETADVVARMLEADPFMRYPTYESLIADLREALRIAKQQNRGRALARRKSRTNTAIAIAVPVLVVISIAAALWLSLKPLQKGKRKPESQSVSVKPTPQVEATEKVLEPEGVPPELEPFTTEAVSSLQDAVATLLQGKGLAAEELLQKMYLSLPKQSMARLWVRLFQAIVCISDQREKTAHVYVNDIAAAHLQRSKERHPALLVRTVARYLLGSGNDAWLFVEASHWPPWLRDFAEFAAGLRNLKQGTLAGAKKHLQNFAGRSSEEHAWVYAWQPLAKKWLADLDRYEKLQSAFKEALDQGDVGRAEELLSESRRGLTGFLRPFLAGLESSLEVARKKKLEEEQRVALLRHQELVQQDLDRLDAAMTSSLPFLMVHNYEAAVKNVGALRAELQTEEGRAACTVLEEAYRRMKSVRELISGSVNKQPYLPKSADLRGEVVGATSEGLLVAVGRYGQLLREWNKVPLSVLVEMGEYYAGQEREITRRADNLVSLAVFCYMHGWFKAAGRYARSAVELDPRVATQVRRLMPGLLEAG